MTMEYSGADLLLYSLFYALVGWAVKVACVSLRDRHFVNSGFLNLPLSVSSGITAALMLETLPTLEGHLVQQFVMTWGIMYIVTKLTRQYVKSLGGWKENENPKHRRHPLRIELAVSLVEAFGYLVVYLLIHPFIFTFVNWLPDVLVQTLAIIFGIIVLLDYVCVHYTMRTNRVLRSTQFKKERTRNLARKISDRVWNRLEKAYPGIGQEEKKKYTFADGICFDKLVWVFLISSFLGAIIEMCYCRAMGDIWMNRSSVVYGAFSFVWGFGAVVLTVVLQKLVGKPDRYVFLAGFVVGGAYEYLCSVFTELVFGTVFWDYSEMPLNIGGRTNVLYCIFWGILSVMWIKVLYPHMEKWIEKIPPMVGKSITWVVVLVMLCNGLLTTAAMQRYTARQSDPEPSNFVEVFLDERYDDAWMENRWPNMKLTETEE